MKTVQFYKEFKVPWIFCWSYKVAQHYSIADKFPMSLFKEFKIKWWDKFNQEICSDTITNPGGRQVNETEGKQVESQEADR